MAACRLAPGWMPCETSWLRMFSVFRCRPGIPPGNSHRLEVSSRVEPNARFVDARPGVGVAPLDDDPSEHRGSDVAPPEAPTYNWDDGAGSGQSAHGSRVGRDRIGARGLRRLLGDRPLRWDRFGVGGCDVGEWPRSFACFGRLGGFPCGRQLGIVGAWHGDHVGLHGEPGFQCSAGGRGKVAAHHPRGAGVRGDDAGLGVAAASVRRPQVRAHELPGARAISRRRQTVRATSPRAPRAG